MIIVTGAAGFIGSCLLWRLNQEGLSDIIIVDHPLTAEKEKNLAGKKFDSFIEKDAFLSLITADRLGRRIDAVFHLGACSSTTVTDVEYFRRNNVEYSKRLAEYALKKGSRFIYASSGATYGDGSHGFSDADDNTLRLKPLNPYGESKHQFDLWVINNNFVDRVVGLKYFNVYGPNEYHKKDMRSVIAKSFEKVVRDGKVRLFKSHTEEYEDGQQKRDFIYVKDAVDVTYFFFDNRHKNGIYNVGTGLARTWNDLAYALFAALDMEPHIEYYDMPESLRKRYQSFTEADITKLRGAGYNKKFYTLEEGVKEYVGFLKDRRYL